MPRLVRLQQLIALGDEGETDSVRSWACSSSGRVASPGLLETARLDSLMPDKKREPRHK